jgi:hypothetical protein
MKYVFMLLIQILLPGSADRVYATSQKVTDNADLPFRFISFVVKDAQTDRPLSEGREDISFQNGVMTKSTSYWRFGDSKKDVIQEEVCSFAIGSLRPIKYRFQNKITGEVVELNGDANAQFAERLIYQGSAGAPKVEGSFSWQNGMIFGKTLHHLIVRSWGSLLEGRSQAFTLFVPMKRDDFRFRVIKKESSIGEPKNLLHLISLEPDNWAVRQLAPAMRFYYSDKEAVPMLMRYEGPTTVVVDNDANRKVVIEFAYDREIEITRPKGT